MQDGSPDPPEHRIHPHRSSVDELQAGLDRTLLKVVARFGVAIVAAWPLLEMVRFVRRGTHLPWGDYWIMIDTLFTDDGATRFSGFFQFHNDHPVMLAKLLYWLNLQIGDGSNITLGYVVILVAAAQVLLIGHLLARSSLTFAERSMLLVLSSALIFAMNGSWSFTKSMSGAAWLTANLFAVIAITLRHHDRFWLAVVAAAAAMVCYGTGLSAWPAVAAVGLARRPWREWWRELPVGFGMLVGYAWYQSESHREGSGLDPTLDQLASTVISLLTAPLRGDLRGVAVAAVLASVVVGARVVLGSDRDAAPWLGLAVYGLASTITIAFGRWQLIADEPVGRYHSLAALFWIGAAALVVFAVRGVVLTRWRNAPQRRRLVTLGLASSVVVAPMIALTWDVTDDVPPVENLVHRQDMAAAALRLGLGEDLYWATHWREDINMDVLRNRGHYPFSSRWRADCGLLGQTLDVDRLPESSFGVVRATTTDRLPGGVVLTSYVPDLESIRCTLAVAPDGVVVGVGVLDDTANYGFIADGARGAVVVALEGHSAYQIVVFADRYPDGTRLADVVTAEEIQPES